MRKVFIVMYFLFLTPLLPGSIGYLLSDAAAKIPTDLYLLLLLNTLSSGAMFCIVLHSLIVGLFEAKDQDPTNP